MKAVSIIGIILILVGVITLASEGITYTKTEKVLDTGPIQATPKHRKTIPISPIAGGAAIAAGVATGYRRRETSLTPGLSGISADTVSTAGHYVDAGFSSRSPSEHCVHKPPQNAE
jgi:hypothetical protein